MYGAIVTAVWRFPGQEKPSSACLYAGAFVTTNNPASLLRCSEFDPLSDAVLAALNEKPPDTGACVRGFARLLLWSICMGFLLRLHGIIRYDAVGLYVLTICAICMVFGACYVGQIIHNKNNKTEREV